MPPLIDSCNDGWKFDTSELGGKVKRMSTCITDVIEFEIVFAIVACGYSQCVCRLPSNCGPTITRCQDLRSVGALVAKWLCYGHLLPTLTDLFQFLQNSGKAAV